MGNPLIPVVINKIKDPDGFERFRAVSSFQEVMNEPSLGKEMIEIQETYAKLIEKCNVQLNILKSSYKNRGNSLLKWDLAKTIYEFIKGIEKKGYYFANSSRALARDLGISIRQVNYLIEFVRTFPDKKDVHKEISWDKYKEILDIKERCFQEKIIKKILQGELKTRESIRKFKKA